MRIYNYCDPLEIGARFLTMFSQQVSGNFSISRNYTFKSHKSIHLSMPIEKESRRILLENEYEALYSVKELLKSRRDLELSMYGSEAGYLEDLLERTEKALMKIVREQRCY